MKGRHIILGVLGALVVTVMGYLYFAGHRHHAEAPRMKGIEETVKLAKNIQQMQATATENLARAEKIAQEIKQMRKPLRERGAPRSPFISPLAEEEATDEKPPAVAAAESAKAPEASEKEPGGQTVEDKLPEASLEEDWPEMNLTGVVISGGDSMAIINEELYVMGDVIEGFKITVITEGRVELMEAMTGRRRALELVAWDMKGIPDEQ